MKAPVKDGLVIIYVEDEDRQDQNNRRAVMQKRRGVLDSPEWRKNERRRLKPNFQYRFFDLGRFAGGGDIPFSYAPEVTLDAKKYPTTTAAFGTAQYEALQGFALGQDAGTLAETFAQATPEVIEKYAIRVRDKNFAFQTIKPGQGFSFNVHGFEYDDETGILEFDGSVPVDEIRSQLCSDIYSSFAVGEDVKFTETDDPDADGVEFSFKKDTDFFMMPRIVFELGREYVNFYTPVDDTDYGTHRTGILNLVYKPLPRELFLTAFFGASNSQTVYDNAAFLAAKEITDATADGRFLINTTQTTITGIGTFLVGNSTAPASQFPDLMPDRPPYEYAAPGIRYTSPIFSTVSFPVSTPPGYPLDAERQNFIAVAIDDPMPWQLFAIAKQDDKTFYCWYKNNGFNGTFFGSGTITIWGNTPS